MITSSIPLHKDCTVIKGIGGQVQSNSYAYLQLSLENDTLCKHKFYVFNTLPCDANGIVGLDFLRTYSACINLENNTLTLCGDANKYVVPLHKRSDFQSHIYVPSRSESIHYLSIKAELKGDYLVCSMQIADNVCLAGGIVTRKSNRIPVKLLNTSEKIIQIRGN